MAERPFQPDQCTIGWVTALPIELAAAQEMLDEKHEISFRYPNDSNIYSIGRIGVHNVVIACLPHSQMGTNSAAVVTTQMKATFPTIQFILMVGIGGGVPGADSDIRLGDVVVSQSNQARAAVIQYDFGKATKDGFQRTNLLNHPPPLLLKAIAHLEAKHRREQFGFLDYVSQLNRLQDFKRENAGPDLLFRADFKHNGGDTCAQCATDNLVDRKPRAREIMIHYGTIASGNQVMKDAFERDRVSRELGGVLCFEMEAAGLMNDFPCLVIRGICDYSDSHKNKGWQGYAAGTAAAYAKELLTLIPPAKVSQSRVTGGLLAEADDILDQLPYAADAPFNSYKRTHDPICLPDTRVNVLHKINEWIYQQDQRALFWLNGLAGTGKSTIARTIARHSDEAGVLGASFFFSRGGGDIGTSRKFATSIARQLAIKSSALKERIHEAIQQHRDIANQSLTDQWHRLITTPLLRTAGTSCPPFLVVVIDALDECDNDDDIMLILRLLAEDQTNGCVQLRFFLTSRPEIPVRRVFDKLPEIRRRRFVLHEIVADTTNDLSIFFNKKLAEVAENHDLGLDWPGSIRIQKLVDHANGLFVWAATACRFIDDGKQFANDRLSTILEGRRGTSEPQDRLDKIYTTVFTHSIYTTYSEEEISTAYGLLRYILGSIVVLFSQLPVDSVAELLGLEGLVVKRTLTDLHSILFIPDNANEPLRLHHPSLRDFLLNTKRCTTPDLYIDKKKAHRMILITCIRLMSTTLKKDICGLRAPGSLVKDVSSHRVEQCLPPGLQYSCLYWGQHLVKSCTDIYDNDFIHRFMEQHLLHWLEALSLMGRVSEGILVINLLISRTVVCAVIEDIDRLELISCQASECPNFCNFIQDAKRFVLYNRVCFQEAPLQVYFSGLIFAPGQSIIKKQFKEQALEWIKQIPKARVRWSPCLQTLEGHNAPVTSVAFRPDNKMLASASGDKTIRLWDPTTGQCLQTLEGHNTWVHSVVFRPDNKILASASRDMTIRLWDSTTGYCLQILKGHNESVESVAFRPDGEMLASASSDKTIRLWDPTGYCQRILKGHNGSVGSVMFRPDGKMLASASSDKTIRLWDPTAGYCLQILEGHNESVDSVAFRPDGKILASASGDKTIRLWHSTTGQCLQILEGHEYWVGSIAFQPDGEMLASASDDEIIRLWNPTTGKCLQTLEGHNTWVHSVAFRPDGKMLASASNDETVRLWDPTTGQCLQTLEDQNESVQTMEGHNGLVTFVAFRPDGKMLASTSGDMTIRLWDSITGQCLHTLKGHHKWVQSVAFQADGRILASASGDKTIRLWNSATGVCLQILKGHNESVESVAFRLDGKMLASASDDMTVRLWDPITGQCLHTLKGHNQRVKSVAFRADGKMLASVSNDDTIYLWDSITGQCLQTFKGHNQQVRSVAFRADGKMLASMSDNDTICLWDCTTGQHLQTLERHYNWVPSFEYSHSVRTLTFLDHYPYLNTNRGIVRVDSIRGNLQSDRQPAYELYLTTSWITLRTRNFLWIPSEYRQPSSSGVHNNMVALGYPSGQVIILIF